MAHQTDGTNRGDTESFTELLGKVEMSVQDRLRIGESTLRNELARKIIRTFVAVNSAVLLLIIAFGVSDTILVVHKFVGPNERLITTQILLAIIGATTVQLGAIAITLSNWLFPKQAT